MTEQTKRNRRYKKLQELKDEGEYFSEESIKLRDVSINDFNFILAFVISHVCGEIRQKRRYSWDIADDVRLHYVKNR